MGNITWDELLKAAKAHWEVYHLIAWVNIPSYMQERECIAMVHAFRAIGLDVDVPDDVEVFPPEWMVVEEYVGPGHMNIPYERSDGTRHFITLLVGDIVGVRRKGGLG